MEFHFDGGSRSNPGHAGSGWVLIDREKDEFVCAGAAYEGDNETNNVAEYSGLIRGLKHVLSLNLAQPIKCYGDSLLVVQQVTGKWRVKKDHLKPLCSEATALLKQAKGTISHIRREANVHADALSNLAMDRKEPAPLLFTTLKGKSASSSILEAINEQPRPAKRARPENP